jgi:hypothetical protein
MHQLDRDGPFPYSRRHPLDAAGSRVTDGEHSRNTGLEEIRLPFQRPFRAIEVRA